MSKQYSKFFQLFTINIALNDDYHGGGIFVQKSLDTYYRDGNSIPDMPSHVLSYDYLETMKRMNSSEVVFPRMKQGDLLLYNFSVYHGIAPIEEGTRYSLVFFYDMVMCINSIY